MASGQLALPSSETVSGIGRFAIMPSRAFFDKRMTKTHVLVLGMLCSYVDRSGWCFPSIQTIATRLGMSRDNVRKSIRVLEKTGYLQVSSRVRPNGSQTSNLYRVLYDLDLPVEHVAEDEEQPATIVKKAPEKPAPATVVEGEHVKVNLLKLAQALSVVCHMEFLPNKGRLMSEAKLISGMTEFSMDNLDKLYGRQGLWYQQDFRGQRGSPPTPAQIRATWLELLGSLTPDAKSNSKEGWFYV